MNKAKALTLVFGVTLFLGTVSVSSANFAYYFKDPAHISGTDPRPSSPTISGMGAKGLTAKPGDCSGLAQYFNSLVKNGTFNLAAF
ncbi:MAG: hypothetical protein ACKVZH_22515 [Blastocatellia bacterium]